MSSAASSAADAPDTDGLDAPQNTYELKGEERNAAILKAFERRLADSRTHRKDWFAEARSLYDMVAGVQWDEDDMSKLKEANRPIITFNVMGKYIDALTGLQINNRQDIRYAPREPGDVRVNELLTGAVAWGRDLSAMIDDETDAFYDCVLTGEGWMEGYIDRDLEASGVPCGERVDPLEMYPDPISRKRNFEDARYMIRVKWVGKDDYAEVVSQLKPRGEGGGSELANLSEDQDLLQVIEQPHDYGTGEGGSGGRRTYPIADYQWWEHEISYRVQAGDLGDGAGPVDKVLKRDEWKVIEPRLIQNAIPYKAEAVRQKCYYRAIIARNQVVTEGECSYKKGFTFHGITGKRDRNKRCWVGIGRALVDPQKWTNKFFSTILFCLTTNAKGGIMAEENAFVDRRKAEDEWSSPDSIADVKEGALQKGKIEPKPVAPYPQGMDRLMEFSLNALPQTSGLNLELLGLADRVQAGVVEAQRKQSAMSIVAWAFDGMRRYYRSMGRMLACYVRDYMDPGTLIRVSGQGSAKYVPLVKDQLQTDFDVIVDEAPSSVNQQERVWAVLQAIIPQLLQAGLTIPPEVITFAPLPQDLKDAWQKALQPDPEKQQIQQQTIQATLQKLINEALEVQSQAQLNSSNADLNKAKAAQIMQEIQAGPDRSHPDPNAQLALEQWKAQMEQAVQTHIAELRANKEAETKMLIAQMQADSAERLELLHAAIEARLSGMQLAQDDKQHQREQATAERIAKGTTDKVGADVGGKLDEVVKTVGDLVKEVKKPKKTRKTVIRNKAGEITGLESTEST